MGKHRLLLSLPTSLAPELQVWFKDLFTELWQRQGPEGDRCVEGSSHGPSPDQPGIFCNSQGTSGDRVL